MPLEDPRQLLPLQVLVLQPLAMTVSSIESVTRRKMEQRQASPAREITTDIRLPCSDFNGGSARRLAVICAWTGDGIGDDFAVAGGSAVDVDVGEVIGEIFPDL